MHRGTRLEIKDKKVQKIVLFLSLSYIHQDRAAQQILWNKISFYNSMGILENHLYVVFANNI